MGYSRPRICSIGRNCLTFEDSLKRSAKNIPVIFGGKSVFAVKRLFAKNYLNIM